MPTRPILARSDRHQPQIGTIATILRAITRTFRVAITNGRLSRLFRPLRAQPHSQHQCRRGLLSLRDCRMGLWPAEQLSGTQGDHNGDTFRSACAGVDILTYAPVAAMVCFGSCRDRFPDFLASLVALGVVGGHVRPDDGTCAGGVVVCPALLRAIILSDVPPWTLAMGQRVNTKTSARRFQCTGRRPYRLRPCDCGEQ